MLLIVVGDVVQQGITQSDYSLTGLVIVLSTMAILTVLISWLSFRFPRLRPVLDGEPIVIVRDGEPILRNLTRERVTLAEVEKEARLQQIDSLVKVKWAVLETNGQISFLVG